MQIFLVEILRYTDSGLVCRNSILFCGAEKLEDLWVKFFTCFAVC